MLSASGTLKRKKSKGPVRILSHSYMFLKKKKDDLGFPGFRMVFECDVTDRANSLVDYIRSARPAL